MKLLFDQNRAHRAGSELEDLYPGTKHVRELELDTASDETIWNYALDNEMTLRRKAGLSDVTIHDLRRSLGSAMASANVNVALVKGALGHKDMKTDLTHYAHNNKHAERDAKEQIHRQWLRAAAEESDDKHRLCDRLSNSCAHVRLRLLRQ
jgi:Phage integrase family.